MRKQLCDKCGVWPRWCECEGCSCEAEATKVKRERDRYRAALESIAKGIYGRRTEGDFSGKCDWEIAKAALKEQP